MKENKDNSNSIILWILLLAVIVLYFIATDWRDETNYCLEDIKELKEDISETQKEHEREMKELVDCYEMDLNVNDFLYTEKKVRCEIMIKRAKGIYH